MSAEDQTPKKKYEKPTLSEVALRPEEAVLGNCKTASTSGPAASDCSFMVGGCNALGS
jgi:hypothetical protein